MKKNASTAINVVEYSEKKESLENHQQWRHGGYGVKCNPKKDNQQLRLVVSNKELKKAKELYFANFMKD